MTDETKDIVILGAGIAGLAAAYRLLQLKPNWHVTILEEGESPGGLASAWKLGRFSADLGPHRLYTELPEIQALIPELVNQDQMLTVERKSELLLKGHFYRYPIRAFELLKNMGAMKMAELAAGMAQGKARAVTAGPSENYEDSMIRAFGKGVYKMILGPYSEKVWKINPADLSEEVARVRVSAGNASKLMSQWFTKKGEKAKPTSLKEFTYIRGGVQGLVDNLREKVEAAGGVIRTGCIVTGLHGEAGHVTHVVTHTCTPPVPADAVISTVPITDLTEMVTAGNLSAGEPDKAMAAADNLEFVGLVLVAIIVNRPQVTPNSWIYFPEPHLSFNRAYEPGNFDESMKPEGQSMMVFEVTARWDSPIWKQSNDEIIEQVKTDAISTGIFAENDINDAAALRVPHTYPLYTKDFRDNLQILCDYLKPVENLITTGRQGLFNHNNMDHSMLMGMRAAENMAKNINGASLWYNNLDQFSHFRIVD